MSDATIGIISSGSPNTLLARSRYRPADFVWLSPDGAGLAVAFRLKQEGHNVVVWVKDKQAKAMWRGLLYHVNELGEALSLVRPETIMVLDGTGGGRTADRFRRQGVRVLGGSRLADRLEIDRNFGFDVMREAGLAVPETVEFDDIAKAKAFVLKDGRRWVFKPSKGDLANAFTFVAEDAEQMIDMFDYLQKSLLTKTKGETFKFILQEFVEGVEISTEGWFDGKKFVPPFNHTMEEKRLATGNHGPNMGCMGNVVWNMAEPDKIVQETLIPLESLLRGRHVGPIDVNCIVRERAWCLEFTPRMGYDSTFAWLELLDGPIGDFYEAFAGGRLDVMPVATDDLGLSVRMLYDRDPITQKHPPGLPIHGVSPELLPHVWFVDMALSEKKKPVTAGVDGYVLTVSGRAPTVDQARSLVYDRVEEVHVPSSYYRVDIGGRVDRDRQELGAWLEPAGQDPEGAKPSGS
jgi:phosphoribosylamine--glycine ligase